MRMHSTTSGVRGVKYEPCTVIWPLAVFEAIRHVSTRTGLSISQFVALALHQYLKALGENKHDKDSSTKRHT